jgi:hypothetical protein
VNNSELKQLIEDEKRQLDAYLKIVKKFKFDDKEVEKQINFYLEKLFELMQKIKENE